MLPMLLIMLISAIIFFPLFFTKNGRTIIGKKRLAQILNQFTKKKKGYVINNIINSKINSDNELIEFNHILVCTSGIYFIKALNYPHLNIECFEDGGFLLKNPFGFSIDRLTP